MSSEVWHKSYESLIAVVSDHAIAETIETYAASNNIADANVQVRLEPLSQAATIVNGGAAIVIVQAGAADETALEKLEELCKYVSGGGAFITILDDPSANATRRLFRAGVTDVLPTPVSESELITAMSAARTASANSKPVSSGAEGKIISLSKTCGGVGATTIAVNLGRELIDQNVGSVAIIDLDVQFGTVGLSLDLQSRMDVTDAIRADDRLDDMLLKSIMTRHKSGLEVLTAPEQIAPMEIIGEPFIELFLPTLRRCFDITIIETPTAWSHWIASVFEGSDLIIPVVETSVRSSDGSKRLMRGLYDFSIKEPPLLVTANKISKKSEVRDRLKQLGNIFGAAPEVLIRSDEKSVEECSDLGRCLKDQHASAPIVQDFSSLAGKVIQRVGAVARGNVGAPPPKTGLFGSILPKLGDR